MKRIIAIRAKKTQNEMMKWRDSEEKKRKEETRLETKTRQKRMRNKRANERKSC